MRISPATTCVSPCIRFGYCCNLRYAEPMSSSSKALLHSCISGEKSLLIKAETKEALGPFITASITQSTQQQPPLMLMHLWKWLCCSSYPLSVLTPAMSVSSCFHHCKPRSSSCIPYRCPVPFSTSHRCLFCSLSSARCSPFSQGDLQFVFLHVWDGPYIPGQPKIDCSIGDLLGKSPHCVHSHRGRKAISPSRDSRKVKFLEERYLFLKSVSM